MHVLGAFAHDYFFETKRVLRLPYADSTLDLDVVVIVVVGVAPFFARLDGQFGSRSVAAPGIGKTEAVGKKRWGKPAPGTSI